MRKRLFYIILVALAGACTPEEQDNPWIGPTCYDGIRNQDEEEIDCGGRCMQCEVFVPVVSPCTSALSDNTLRINDRNVVAAISDYSCDISTVGYTIAILIDGVDSFVVHLGGSGKPTKSGTYTIVSDIYSVGTTEAAIHYEESGYDYPFTNYGGTIYVTVTKDKKITAEFCSVTLNSRDYWGYEVYYRIVSGRISGCLQ
ncbi:hypothetical protein [Dawidia soli]|uniref:Lipoprotein n=1 Tax=Dawidia soli TaxID=2782352 RepID=A0AAP2D5Z1_9BACT|nr:hypothetical protein [Dawidia soli]MBT1685938.1 hypothetical protein [Dawidia soli]